MQIKAMATGPLSVNTYYVMDEETRKGFLVDPGGYSPAITAEIEKDGARIEYILLTHGHGDHIGGVEAFRRDFPQARVVASAAEGPLLADPHLNMSDEGFGEGISLTADVQVEDGDLLQVGNLELQFLMTPGHSPGSMCIHTEDVVFSGDTLFHGSIGRTDFPGGSYALLKAGVHNKLFVLPDGTAVYPGHMGPTTIGFERKNNPFV